VWRKRGLSNALHNAWKAGVNCRFSGRTLQCVLRERNKRRIGLQQEFESAVGIQLIYVKNSKQISFFLMK
jgi:hypothetical protein